MCVCVCVCARARVCVDCIIWLRIGTGCRMYEYGHETVKGWALLGLLRDCLLLNRDSDPCS